MPTRPVNALSIAIIAVIDQLTATLKPEHALEILSEIMFACRERLENLEVERENGDGK